MGPKTYLSLSMAGSPAAWAIVIVLGLVILSPKLLPVIARLLADHVTKEARRRLGIPFELPRPKPRRPTVEVEVIPPEQSIPTLRASSASSLGPKPKSTSAMPVWLFVVVVTTAVAVLSWLLLRTR